MADPTFTHVDADDESARWVMGEFFDELDRRFVGGYDGPTALAEAHLTLSPPHGLFVLVSTGGACVGGAGIHWLDGERAEIKRVWLAPAVRRRGYSKLLMTHLEGLAVERGLQEVVLDSNGILTEAITLYERLGYDAIPSYNDNPYATHWFAKRLVTLAN